jgi:broad specificity phosphatase PhoE
LTDEGFKKMKEQEFIEKVLRTNPDIIYTSPSLRTIQTAEEIVKIMKEYRNKKIKIKIDERLRVDEKMDMK